MLTIRRLKLPEHDSRPDQGIAARAPRQQGGIPVDRPGETSVSVEQAAEMLRERGGADLALRLCELMKRPAVAAAQALDS